MKSQENLRLAQNFLDTLGRGATADQMSALCSPELDWNIPGDAGVLPWVGHKVGRHAMNEFIRDTQALIERESLEIQDVLANDDRAVILGHLRTKITSTGKIIEGAFASVLTFADAKIASFLMLEDSFATSNAAR